MSMYVLTFEDEEQGVGVVAVAYDADTLKTHALQVEAEEAEGDGEHPRVDDLAWCEELEGSDTWISRNIYPTFENFYRIRPVKVV